MSTPNNGGPAFPEPFLPVGFEGFSLKVHSGMSLRDWFAGQFLTTIEITGMADGEEIATACYKMADAMLAAREAK